MPKASNDPETDAFIQEYRRQKELRGGRGYMNGVPSEVALGRPQGSIGTNNPPARVAPQRPSYPAVTPEQADRAMATAELVGQQRANEQMLQGEAGQDRYNLFLKERGIDPNRIGAATIRETKDGRRVFDNPSLREQEYAANLRNAANAMEGRERIAARRAYIRGDAPEWANAMNSIQRDRMAAGGRNPIRGAEYWYNLAMGGFPYRSNGFGY